ncbi:hypothetical protein FHG87_011379 [Trinorchestia longiramus]|nr:hypothetical protein FHG87_011379 [Trinorchestia longiramus]
MFSCFGLRSRQKTLNSSLSDCGELRVPLTPKDGVPLNFHNHHNKYALFQYYNTLQRPSFHSSRRNSQTSCGSGDSTSKTAKSEELRPKSENFSLASNDAVPDGLKITDIDNNTTDIIKCNGDFVTVSNGADFIKKYGKHKKSKKQSQTLPKNISIENFEGLRIGNGNWKNKKNVRLSELFSNPGVQKVSSLTKANSSNQLETEISENSLSNLLKYSCDKKSSKSEKSLAKALKKELKKQAAQNRGLSPTDLDSYATQKQETVEFVVPYVASTSISDSKINSSSQHETESLPDKTESTDASSKAAASGVAISCGGADDEVGSSLSEKREAPVLLTPQKTQDDAVTSKKGESGLLLKSLPKKLATPLNDVSNAAFTGSKIPLLPQSKNGLIKVGVKNDAANFPPDETKKITSSPNSESSSLASPVGDAKNPSSSNAERKFPPITDTSELSESVVSTKCVQSNNTKQKNYPAASRRLPANGKAMISKLPYRRPFPRTSESLSPVSYSRLPIASDKKPSVIPYTVPSPKEKSSNTECSSENPETNMSPVINGAVQHSRIIENLDENSFDKVVIQVSSTKIESGGSLEGETKTLCLMDIDDSSIPMIDTDDAIPTGLADDGLSKKFNEKPPKQFSKIPTIHATSVSTVESVSVKSEKPFYVPSITAAPFRIFPDGRKRKQSDTDPAINQPVKTARSTRSSSAVASDTAELKRLEAALSAKSSEVEEAKREAQEARNEACEAGKGLQALTVLVHHLTKQYEAFSNPLLKTEIARLQKCLQDAEQALGESRNALEAAETRLSEEQASAALQQQQLNEEHESAVQQLRQQHEQQLQRLKEQQQLQLEELNKKHEGDTAADREKHQQEIERLRAEHEQKITSLVREHEEKLLVLNDDVARLKKLQENGLCHDAHVSSQVLELTAAQAEREQELQAQSLSLQKEGEKLKERNKKLHESLLSDTDHRLVGIRQHCSDLQKEVDSLKSVVEMRNCELHKLRAQVLTMEQLERDLEAARHLAKTLQAKTEDLNAQMNTKAQTERQLMQSNLQLKETMDRESSANKQLRLENEQLQWKLRQREQLSHSLPPSSLDGMSRISHLNTSWQDRPASLHHQHVFREEQQSSLNRSGSIREEKGPLTSSPVHVSFGGKRDPAKCNSKDFYDEHSRMRGTFNGLSPPSSPCVKAVVEKSNSVSFVLDLNDSLSDESYLDFPASPRMKHTTPVLDRKSIQKSRSSSLEKKQGTKVGRSNSLSKCTSAGNFFSRLHAKEVKPKPQKLATDSDGDQHMQSGGSVAREHTTSESSCGAESVERVSPNGLSWTVPVDDCSPNSPHSPKLESPRGCFSSLRHLHQPEEDEYEENLEENEDSFIAGIPSDLTPLVNLMNASSSSPSDSELSHCGSQAGLTSESEEESSLAESSDRVGDSLSPVAEWVSTVGAGEAMVPSELVSNCGESESTDSSDQIVTKDSIPTRVMANELHSTRATPNNSTSGCTVVNGSANEEPLRQN